MDDLHNRLQSAATKLDDATASLGQGILGLDEGRSRCGHMANRYDDFASRMESTYPSLAGPAARLGELFRELDEAMGRLSARTEEMVVSTDKMVMQARGIRSKAS